MAQPLNMAASYNRCEKEALWMSSMNKKSLTCQFIIPSSSLSLMLCHRLCEFLDEQKAMKVRLPTHDSCLLLRNCHLQGKYDKKARSMLPQECIVVHCKAIIFCQIFRKSFRFLSFKNRKTELRGFANEKCHSTSLSSLAPPIPQLNNTEFKWKLSKPNNKSSCAVLNFFCWTHKEWKTFKALSSCDFSSFFFLMLHKGSREILKTFVPRRNIVCRFCLFCCSCCRSPWELRLLFRCFLSSKRIYWTSLHFQFHYPW